MNRYIALVLAVGALASIYGLRVRRPPHERYLNDPNEMAIVAFWNAFSSRKWTPEGLAYHRHLLKTAGLMLSLFVVGLILLKWLE
jgi:hypothetical protein